MKNTKLKRYIVEVRGVTIKTAADQIGLSRPHLTYLCNGLPAGRRAARLIAEWSGGMLSEQDTMFPVEIKDRQKSCHQGVVVSRAKNHHQ